MADIQVKCSSCGAACVVSEYIDPEAASCQACGAKLKLPRKAAAKQPRAPEIKKPASDDDMVLTSYSDGGAPRRERSTVTAAVAVGKRAKSRKERKSITWTPTRGTLLAVFIVLTLTLTFLRFSSVLSPADHAAYCKFGLIALAVGWVIVVLDAFHEHMMHGLLSLFIPPYSLWFLFAQCDSFILRVGIGAMLIPFGPDMARYAWYLFRMFLTWMGADHFDGQF